MFKFQRIDKTNILDSLFVGANLQDRVFLVPTVHEVQTKSG